MKKAKYIGKSYGGRYNRDYVFLEYEYRGRRYEIYENRRKGNIPLSWQHRNAQIEIDAAIEKAEKLAAQEASANVEPVEKSLERFFAYLDGDEEAFTRA